MNIKSLLLAALLPLAALAGSSFNFNVFTDNGNYNNAVNDAYYLRIDQTDNGYMNFNIMNNSYNVYSVISAIYIEDLNGSIYNLSIQPNGDVEFTIDDRPSEFPSGQNLLPPFESTASIRANPPPALNGIEPGEQLNLTFLYNEGYNDLVEDVENGDVRVGIHVIAFPDESSESAVIHVVPEPQTMLLFALGICGLLLWRKSRIKNETQN